MTCLTSVLDMPQLIPERLLLTITYIIPSKLLISIIYKTLNHHRLVQYFLKALAECHSNL